MSSGYTKCLSQCQILAEDWQHYKFDPDRSLFISVEGQETPSHFCRRNIKEHIVGVSKLEREKILKRNPGMLDFSAKCHGASQTPPHCLLIMSHYKT